MLVGAELSGATTILYVVAFTLNSEGPYNKVGEYPCLDARRINDAKPPLEHILTERGCNPTWMPTEPETRVSYFFPPRLMKAMEDQLKIARAKAADESSGVKARLRLVEREFEYLKVTAAVFCYYQAYQLEPNWNTFDQLAKTVQELQRLIESWYGPDNNMIIEDGWCRFMGNIKKDALLLGGVGTAWRNSEPLKWDYAYFKTNNLLPLVKVQRGMLAAPKAKNAVVLDGRLDDEAWQAVAPTLLASVGAAKAKEQTSFKVIYDDKALFIGVQCQMTNASITNLASKGHDGPYWTQECLEFFIDPFGYGDTCYRFGFNPTTNSYGESIVGVIDDPANPNYGRRGPDWNGKWEYRYHLNAQKGEWTGEVRIPFDTLGVAAPDEKDIWRINIGRRHYLPGGEEERSLWTYIPGKSEFSALQSMGEIQFIEIKP